MTHVYPAVFRPDDGMYCIFFPDIGMGATQGDDMADGIRMAEDFLGNALIYLEDNNQEIPKPQTQQELMGSPEYQDGDIITFIQSDTVKHRKNLSKVLVKKTLTIPANLNERAVEAGINFSQALQRALKEELSQ